MATLFTGKGFPLGVLEERMIIRCIHGATGAPDAEADLPLDLVSDPVQILRSEIGSLPVGSNGGIAAGNIEHEAHPLA